LLCAACLARSLVAKPGAFSRWSVWFNQLKLVGALAFAWMVFYFLGSLLLRIPPAFHEGSAWSSITEENQDP
jgi:hypothetical protein